MSQIRKGTSASSPDFRNINVNSTNPLSDISNDMSLKYLLSNKSEAVERTKAKRIYSNSKRFNTISSQSQSTLNYSTPNNKEYLSASTSPMGSNTSFTITESTFDVQIIEELTLMLDTNNALVKSYRQARNCLNENPYIDLKLSLIGKRSKDGRTYNLPEASEVAALVIGDLTQSVENHDIVVKTRSGQVEHISELHPSYLSLQYPLLFPYGDDMYRVDILQRGLNLDTKSKRPMCTMREFFAYRLQDCVDKFSVIHNAKRLFQHFVVDAYTMMESERLFYIRRQQTHLRSETVQNIQNANNARKKRYVKNWNTYLYSIFVHWRFSNMMQNYLDAMSLCKWFGYPDFFITITCNPIWLEVQRFLKDTTIRPEDRPDILCRIFKIKLDSITKDLNEGKLLGRVNSVVYTVEFQKRGLPHAHICVFMHADSKIRYPIISAEIPDIAEDPELYKLVVDYMIHGPCGALNMNCPCMVDRKCSKKFPKKFVNETCLDKKGFPVYCRRDSGLSVVKSRVNVDNRYVVPYSKVMLKRYQAHINVEWCNQGGSIKYLFKYINKGPDITTLKVVESGNQDEQEPVVDEIEKYYDCRYISACESAWRIFSYDIHYQYPAVTRLPFHLPGQQNVVYGAYNDIDEVLNKPSVASTMFLSWMKCNERLPEARELTYVEFPSKDACHALGLLDDDNEYIEAIKEDLHYSDEEIKNLALLEIEKFLLRNNSSLRNYSNMPYPDDESISSSNNRLINEELSYDQNTMEDELNSMLVLLTDEQRNVFDQIMESVITNKGSVFFLYGYGGTGRTTHSRFSIPLNLNEDSLFRMKPGSEVAY
ncbi:uncharacterized protein LOC110931806 [Helianthus annuus]|uniref:uncharacterized protein LOC110931806 n=1 Tax=Helianthus annuus TaxID=4232 RepID=UPI000B8FFC9C|nr:uncharacterized protein LOC110931806 [Helianthus annuus]